MKRTLIHLFLLALAAYSNGYAESIGVAQVPRSHRTYLQKDAELEFKTAAFGSGSLWLLVGTREKGSLSGPQKLQLWNTGSNGEVISVTDVSGIVFENSKVLGLTLLTDGTPLLFVESGQGKLTLAALDRSTRRISSHMVTTLASTGRYFTKVITASNNDVLGIGRNGTQGYLIRMHPSGEVVSEVLLKDPNFAVVTDLAEMAGGYVLCGASLPDSNHISGWIAKVTLNGYPISQSTFPGRFTHLAYANKTYVVVTDTIGKKGVNLIALGFSEDLKTSWTTEVLTDVEFIRPFDVKALHSGGFMIAGAGKTGLLWIAKLDADGVVAWHYEFREESFVAERLWDYKLILNGDNVELAYGYLVVRDTGGAKYEQRQVVKLTDFSTK